MEAGRDGGDRAARPESRAGAKATRIIANAVLASGVLALAWAVLVWQWKDPFSSLYTSWQQHKLAGILGRQALVVPTTGTFSAREGGPGLELAHAAAAFRQRAAQGDPIGRISIPRIGLNMIVVNGTESTTLRKGPGRYLGSFMPGEGRLVYIAGHRTTYLAPFARIDELKSGDRVTLAMPYATLVYSVVGHRIVTAGDLSVLRSGDREQLVLQACHPRFFATHRYLVYATPVEAALRH